MTANTNKANSFVLLAALYILLSIWLEGTGYLRPVAVFFAALLVVVEFEALSSLWRRVFRPDQKRKEGNHHES